MQLTWPLTGRSEEMRAIEAATVASDVSGIVVCGAAGVGKSRIAREALSAAASRGCEVRWAVGTSSARAIPLGAFTAWAESGVTDTVQLVRLLIESLTAAPAGTIAEAVQTYLLACVGGGAGLVVAEDVHWFDPSTIEVLAGLLSSGEGRLLVVITGRPRGWLPTGWPVKVFDLAPLTDEQTDALIVALNPGLSARDRALVANRCDGVPFYIEQVVAALGETGVPEALYEPLFARLRASANVVPVVEAAAVIGRQVDRGLLCSVVDLSDDEVDDVVDELEDALVFEPWGPDGWRFRHELLREVAAELAPPTVRRGLHAKVADALSGCAGGEPDWPLVAGHFERAERFDEAASAYQQASSDARRRGALAEAATYLTQALAQLDRSTPGPDRDRRETVLRLERGFLTSAAEGYQSREAAADFERCLQLGGTGLREDELFATLLALVGYYTVRADLRRAAQVIKSLRVGLEQGRQWSRPEIEARLGVMACLRGEFDAACRHLEAATAGLAAADRHDVAAVWRFVPNDPIASAYLYLALITLVRGDLTRAETELARAARRADGLGFPQGPYMHAYKRFMDTWLRIEAGQLDRAAVLAADLSELAERHGFDLWRLAGATQQAFVGALAALGADHVDATAVAAHIATITTLLDTLRTLEVNMYLTVYDAVLGRLLIAAGQTEQARDHLDTALRLAQDTEMCFYDAELLRLRAHTHTDPDARRADLGAALALARRQGATLFELRAALNDFELRGEPARAALAEVVRRFPRDGAWPELARAHASLAQATLGVE